MASITLDKASLTFQVRRRRRVPLKEVLLNLLRMKRDFNPKLSVHALDQISLSVNQGDRLAIIGHNGAGKSTLLRVLAGVYPLTGGKRTITGRVSSLFDLLLGFELDATGRENIYFRGYLLGETPSSLKPKIESILDFAELGDFIDTPLRYYSAGMRLRLGFAIATAIEPEILLIDECFSAGDQSFQQKARQRMQEMMNKASLIGMVSHDLELVRELASRVVWLDHGQIRQVGTPDEVIPAYVRFMNSPEPRLVGANVTRAA